MGADGTPTVMVVDDHPIWRDAVARDLAEGGFDVVATADGVAARAPARGGGASRCGGDGHGGCPTATARRPPRRCSPVSPASAKILVLSASDERDDVLEAVKAGATGYLVKSASKQELGDAVRATAEGRAVFLRLGWQAWCWGSTGASRRPRRRRPRHAEPHRPRNRDTAPRREGVDGQADRRPAVAEPPHRREPRAGHVPQAAVANRVELARYAIEHGLDGPVE